MAPAALAFSGKVMRIKRERLTRFIVGMRTCLDTFALSYFVCCGIARLARYNATVALAPKDATGKVNYFEGTPIPTTLALVACIACFVRCDLYMDALPGSVIRLLDRWELHPFVLAYVLSGTLMISKTLRIPKPWDLFSVYTYPHRSINKIHVLRRILQIV